LIEFLIGKGVRELRESHVKQFQQLAIENIYSCGGQYRTTTRTARLEGGGATHIIPSPAAVPGLALDAIAEVNKRMADPAVRYGEDSHVIEVAAYALWRFNWIHPFAGGNGRTARAIAYMLLCIDYGGMIKGSPTMPTIIAKHHEEYQTALREADAAEQDGREDISAVIALVDDAMTEQLKSVAAGA
jgi:Fic family protein